jgi:DNA replication protein DnaC
MLLEPTLDKLYQLKLPAMADAVRAQQDNPAMRELTFEERLGFLVDREWDARENRGLTRRLQVARLKVPACVEDLDFRAERGLDKGVILRLAECQFIAQHHHVLITGPTGVGKTYLACALGQAACRRHARVRYHRCDQLLPAIALARLDGSYPAFMRKLEKTEVLILDDWGVTPFDQAAARELFDLLDDRATQGALIIASQAPLDTWYDLITAPQLADAILDRVVHNAYKIHLHGESMRKRQAALTAETR